VSFAREGYPFIGAGLALAAIACTFVGIGAGGLGARIGAGVLSVLALFVVWFFRDPLPPPIRESGAVVAPGQGRVIAVEEVDEPTFLQGRARRISIFLSVFDVHVQRAPVTGMVGHRSYRSGTYVAAWREKASEDNEQASLGITTPHGRVLVRQIAGLIARRIVTDPNEGDPVERGRRIGLIRFGSRVDLFLPLDWEVACGVGDRVLVGRTVVAYQPTEKRT
jgi:phosphatidylserine decarboxylase